MSVTSSVAWGLVAMFGYGLGDFFASLSTRRVGTLGTYFWMQVVGVVLLVPYFVIVVTREGFTGPWGSAALLITLFVFAGSQVIAYLCMYKAFQIGNLSVVSPIVSSFAAVTVLLSLVFLGESLTGWRAVGVALALLGTMVTSTDFGELRKRGGKRLAAGVPYALIAMVTFGASNVLVAVLSRQLGWFLPIYFARLIAIGLLLAGSRVSRVRLVLPGTPVALALVACVGVLDTTGFFGYSVGTSTGISAVVAPVSATFPVVTVILARFVLGEQLVPNRLLGIATIIGGLVMVAV